LAFDNDVIFTFFYDVFVPLEQMFAELNLSDAFVVRYLFLGVVHVIVENVFPLLLLAAALDQFASLQSIKHCPVHIAKLHRL